MQIGQTIVNTTAPQLANSPTSAFSSGDFQTFLRMLTTQMQNQDPLNPVDSSDYAVQLATFSGVEQAVRTNQLLEEMQGQFSLLGMAQLAGWVGKEARVAAPVFMDGTPVTLSPTPAASANRAILIVQDTQGQIVAREELPLSTAPYQWLGRDMADIPLRTGNYTLSVESYFDDDLLMSTPIEHYAPILEARGGVGGTRLLILGGAEVDAATVTALRVPASPRGAGT